MSAPKEQIYEGIETLILKTLDDRGNPVIQKVLKSSIPTNDQFLRFRNEYEYTYHLEVPGIRKALEFGKVEDKYCITLQYIDGATLLDTFRDREISIEEILKLFISVTDSLMQVHQQGIIHKDINPQNILIENKTQNAFIIDFGISGKLDSSITGFTSPDRLKGTLSYMSPEQTGRLNRKVDQRSDLYALGVTFYELLTGELPYTSNDSLELVHFHIAKEIPLVHKIRKDIPEVFSEIIARLMAKNAEDRYQSALGLKYDFELAFTHYNKWGRIDPFPLQSSDLSGKFQIPEKLYGRYEEIKLLLKSFDHISKGSVELALVSGYSGVGKTALISELYKPITEKKSYFLSGKFDQNQKTIPYFAITQAIQVLCSYLLTEKESVLQYWKKLIQESIGENGQVLCDLIPPLKNIIGEQPLVAKLDGQEALNRVRLVIQNLIKGICKKEHPMVIFTDDLQWADSGSLDLIRMLVSDTTMNHLLIIGAYRDNEVGPGHPLMHMIAEMERDKVVQLHIQLLPLKEEHVAQMVHDTLSMDDVETHRLTECIFSKTQGNAFFTKEFFKNIYRDGDLHYNLQEKKWVADHDSIHKRGVTSNVVDFLVSKLSNLAIESQKLLSLASCIGNKFDMVTLEGFSGMNSKEIIGALWKPLQEQYINSLTDGFEFMHTNDEFSGNAHYEFAHDRIQQAAYAMLPDKEITHHQIAKLLEKNTAQSTSQLFDIVNHYNACLKCLQDPIERDHVHRLNMKASEEAMKNGAFVSAKEYILVAQALAPSDIWKKDFDCAMSLLKQRANLEYFNGNFAESESLIHEALKKVKAPEDQADLYFLLMQNYSTQARYQDAITTAREGLKKLNFTFPLKDEAEALIPGEFQKIFGYFGTKGILPIAEMSEMEDIQLRAIMHLLDNLSPNTYVANEINLWTLHVLYKINLTIEHGLTAQGGYAFEELSIICNLLNHFEIAYNCAELGIRILEKLGPKASRHAARTQHLYINYNLPNKKHIKESIQQIPRVYQQSLDTGEFLFGGYLSMFSVVNHFFWGKEPVEMSMARIKESIPFLEKIGHPLALGSVQAIWLILNKLADDTYSGIHLTEGDLTDNNFLHEHTKALNYYAITYHHLLQANAMMMLNEAEKAHNHLLEFEKMASVVTGCMQQESMLRSVRCTIHYDLSRKNASHLTNVQAILDADLEKTKLLMEFNPENSAHRYHHMVAEKCAFEKNDSDAIYHFEEAIRMAEKYEFMRDVAWVHQRAAHFWMERENWMYAATHLEHAFNLYQDLGYKKCVQECQTSAIPSGYTLRRNKILSKENWARTTSQFDIDQFDIQSILKASNLLSEEIVFEKLVINLLKIVIENVGGQRVVLLLQEGNDWNIISDYDINKSAKMEVIRTPLEQESELPLTVINYVTRTQKEVLSAQKQIHKIFEKDKYLSSKRTHEFICLPLIYKGDLIGILYVESSLPGQTFSEERLNILYMLTSQMAVSLENAHLYEKQSQLNAAYQKFVPLEFIEALGHNDILQVKLGNSIDEDMTVMFCDIRSYTSLAEGMSAHENFEFINAFLKVMVPVIREHGGFVNHFLGDGFIALFKSHPAHAIAAGQGMFQALHRFNEERKQEGKALIDFGIGIHTGKVMMGIIGDSERHDANVLSDAVNLSSRLEGLTKAFGTSIICSSDTYKLVQDNRKFSFRFLGKVRVKGKSDGLPIYELINVNNSPCMHKKLESLELYNSGMNAYFEKNFTEAAVALRKVLDNNPEDLSSKRYLQNSARLMVESVPKDWDGVEDIGKS